MNKGNIIRLFKYSGLTICFIVFIVLAFVIYFNKLEPLAIDVFFRDLAYKVRGEEGGFLYHFFKIITEFGNFYVIAVIVLIMAILTRIDNRFFLVLFGLMSSVLIVVGMKNIYSRERPIEELRWATELTSSFPSGHSAAAGFLYVFLFYLTFHTDKIKRNFRIILNTIFVLIIFLVMTSRIILGVHYFTDVIAGFSIGVMVSCLCMLLYRYSMNNGILTNGILNFKKNKKS